MFCLIFESIGIEDRKKYQNQIESNTKKTDEKKENNNNDKKREKWKKDETNTRMPFSPVLNVSLSFVICVLNVNDPISLHCTLLGALHNSYYVRCVCCFSFVLFRFVLFSSLFLLFVIHLEHWAHTVYTQTRSGRQTFWVLLNFNWNLMKLRHKQKKERKKKRLNEKEMPLN